MPREFSIPIDRVVDLLGLVKEPSYTRGAASYNVKCPFCGDKKYHMNINTVKNTYNCVLCCKDDGKSGGGALALYGRAALGVELKPGKRSAGGNGSWIYAKLLEALGSSDVKTENPYLRSHSSYMAEQSGIGGRIESADDSTLHRVYSALLAFPPFSLSDQHKENLLRRGLDEKTIVENQYRSIPYDLYWIDSYPTELEEFRRLNMMQFCDEQSSLKKTGFAVRVASFIVGRYLTKQGIIPKKVPGFYQLNGEWFFRIDDGMIIPTRNHCGEIVSLQLRTDHGNLRYRTISSKGLPHGVTEGISRLHYPLHNGDTSKPCCVYLTEGPLKADVALHLMEGNNAFLAIQGVANRKELPAAFAELKANGVTTVYNALDMDKITNPHVAAACKAIRALAKKEGLKMDLLSWDSEYAAQKNAELRALCLYHGIDTARADKKEDVFVSVGILADALTKCNVEHSIRIGMDRKENKCYWSDKTKGIDDFLLREKKSKDL